MIAIDTNLLVYAHREDSTWHESAFSLIRDLAEGTKAWAIPWPCVHEFLAIVTHAHIYRPATPLNKAIEQVSAWLESPPLMLLTETLDYWKRLEKMLATSKVTGAKIHDARIAAICLHHGFFELWSADRDFGRFPDLVVKNPLVG